MFVRFLSSNLLEWDRVGVVDLQVVEWLCSFVSLT